MISGDYFGWNFGLPAGGFGGGATTRVLTQVALTGLTASFHTLRDGCARVLFAPGGGLRAPLSPVAIVAVPDYRPGLYGVAAFVIAAVIYSPFYGRHRPLADSPQERAALGATVANQHGGGH